MQSVAIIGAGLSGLSCARYLQDRQIPVRLFEKSRGPGGRLSSKRMDGFSIDMGAPFMAVQDPEFRAQAGVWKSRGWVDCWEAAGTFLHPEDLSMADCYAIGVPRMSALGRHLAEGLEVETQCRIQSLLRETEGWWLLDDQQQRHGPFSHVMVSAPAPQTLDLVAAHSPMLAAPAARPMLCTWVVLLHFSVPSLRTLPLYQFNQGPLRLACCDSAKPHREIPGQSWTLYADEIWSQQHCTAEPAWVGAQLAEAFLSQVSAIDVGQLVAQHSHRWLYARPQQAGTEGAVLDAGMGLGICGDWLSSGDAEGAWLSGRQLAQMLIG